MKKRTAILFGGSAYATKYSLESQIKNKIVQLVIGVGLNIIHAPIINEYGTTSIKDCALEHANNLEKMQILNNNCWMVVFIWKGSIKYRLILFIKYAELIFKNDQ